MDEELLNTKIGQTLMKLRKEKKISREQVAAKMGVSSVAVYYWENGKGLKKQSNLLYLSHFLKEL